MIKKQFIGILLAILILSACGGSATPETTAPIPTETRAAIPTEASPSELPITTETSVPPTEQSAPTVAPGTPIPTNSPDCTNSASFVTDVTIPDNSEVGGGAAFTKTWRVRNTGTCAWGSDYTLTHYSDERMGAAASVPLGATLPGQNLDISLNLTAPNNIGFHRGNFVIKNPAGLIMQIDNDSRLWVIIKVAQTTAAITTTSVPAGNPVTVTITAPSASGGSIPANAACPLSTDLAKVTETINAINAYRAQNNIPAYAVNSRLTQAAQSHANDMACNKLFGHAGSDKSTPQTRVSATSYKAMSVTENVYGSYPPLTGQGAVAWWANDMTDIRHNQNLLSKNYTEIGVGYSFYDNFGYYVVVFAAPSVR